MNKTIPIIHEPAADLKQRLQQERDPRKRQRLHALYLLASGHATNRSAVATLLGLDRNTIGRWLTQYREGGLATLLAVYVPAGKRPALTPAQVTQLRQRLQQPDGFASYGAIQQWIATTLGVQMGYHAVHTLVHDKLQARPKVARPRHEKKVPRR
jgi:transposase